MVTDTALTYGVLGALEVRRGDHPVDLGPPKQRAVLACLLLARGRVVSSDRLLEVVWGEDLPASALPSLQVYVSNLRRLLRDEDGSSPVVRRSPGYVLEGVHTLDADDFAADVDAARVHAEAAEWAEALQDATRGVGRWHGPVLDDLGDATWLVGERQRLEERLVEARSTQVTALLGLDRADDAVAAARVLRHDEPLRDDGARLEMLALHRAGRTPEALDVFAAHAALLDDELGLEPSAQLRELQVALLRQEPWAARWPHPDTAPTSGPVGAPVQVAEPSPRDAIVGRARELGLSEQVLDEVVAGASRSLLLTGPAGIGKTRLAEEVLSGVVRRGGRVVRARSVEEEGAPAWWPLRQVVRDLGADPDEVLAVPAGADADTLRFAVYERVLVLLQGAARSTPLAVLVDDLQWVDPTSARCLVYLASALGSAPVLLVATIRDGEGGAPLRHTVAGILRADGARQVVVPPLDEREVAELAQRIAGEELGESETRALTTRTQGNALFVREYARLPRRERTTGQVPLAVRSVLGRRIEGLDDDVRSVLQIAAASGDVLDLDLLTRVSELPYDVVVDRLDEAAAAHIIEPVPDGVGFMFSHALLRDEVLAALTPLRRQRLHGRIADVLATAGRERITARAQHMVAAGALVDPRELVEACRAAALQAEERVSSETAVGWWEHARAALALLPTDEQDPQEHDDLVVAQVEALVRAGRGQTVLDVVDTELVASVRTGGTSTAGRLAATLLRSAGTWPWVTFGADPGPVLERLRSVEPFVEGDVAAHARVLAALAVGTCYDLDPAVPDDLSRRALELAESTDDPDVLADALLGRVLTYVGVAAFAEECEEHLYRLLALPRRDYGPDVAVAHSALTMSRMILGDLPGVEHHLRLGIANSDLYRLRVVRAQLRWMEVGVVHWHRGPTEALQMHAAASAAHLSTELYEGGFTNFNYCALRWDEGTLGDEPDYEGFEQLTWDATMAAARGQNELAAQNVRARLVAEMPLAWSSLGHHTILGHVVADIEDVDLAHELLAWLEPYAGLIAAIGQGPVAGPVDLARARLQLLLGDAEAAAASARAARELSERNQGPHWVARCDELIVQAAARRPRTTS